MRIGLICQSCNNRTGIGRIVRSLSSEYIALGHQVTCAAQHFEDIDIGITKCSVPSLPVSKGLNKFLFRLNGSPFGGSEVDVAHTFGIGRGAHVVSAQSCHRAGVELLRSKRDLFLERSSFGLYDRISLGDERALLMSQSTKRVIAVSLLVRSQIEDRYRLDPKRVSIVPNGVQYGLFEGLRNQVDRPGLRMRLGVSQDDFVLLFVGNEFGRKGLRVLVKSLSVLKDRTLRLFVVGSGDQKPYAKFSAELGVAGSVSFMGNIPAPETMYLAADAFVLPSLYEPFGIVILEAMAAGVPVITSGSSGAVEGMINHRHVLLVDDPTSVEQLTEAIRLLRRDEKLRQDLIIAGAEKAKEFSWDKIARKALAVYEDAIRES